MRSKYHERERFRNFPNDGDTQAVIYCIENVNNGKLYIGQTTNFAKRMKQHAGQLANGSHFNNTLQEDYNNGDEFEIGCIFRYGLCGEDVKFRERTLRFVEYLCIVLYESHIDGYNRLGKAPDNMIDLLDEANPDMLTNRIQSTFEVVIRNKETGEIIE